MDMCGIQLVVSLTFKSTISTTLLSFLTRLAGAIVIIVVIAYKRDERASVIIGLMDMCGIQLVVSLTFKSTTNTTLLSLLTLHIINRCGGDRRGGDRRGGDRSGGDRSGRGRSGADRSDRSGADRSDRSGADRNGGAKKGNKEKSAKHHDATRRTEIRIMRRNNS
jgi:hypothetical protein